MTAPVGRGPAGTGTQEQQLRRVAAQLEGVFTAQLFQAMRATVPEGDGLGEASQGEKMFTAMFDEQVAGLAAGQSKRGLAEAIYRQLRQQLSPATAPAQGPGVGERRGNDR